MTSCLGQEQMSLLQLIIVRENSSSENLSHVIGENESHSFRIELN